VDGVPVDLVIDTGLDVSVGNEALLRKLDPKTEETIATAIADVNGNTLPIRIMVVRQLKIDNLRFPKPMIAFADTPVFDELGLHDRPALLLGMNHLRLFRKIAVDFRLRQIAFDLYKVRG